MAITDWPAAERPREKLLERGAAALSDAELLAIFLRVGVRGKSAVDLARDLLKHFEARVSKNSMRFPAWVKPNSRNFRQSWKWRDARSRKT